MSLVKPMESDESAVCTCKCYSEDGLSLDPKFVRLIAKELLRNSLRNAGVGAVYKTFNGVND